MTDIEFYAMCLSQKLRKHFCKNYNIPIKIFEDPYFTDRCILFNDYYGVQEKIKEYFEDVSKYDNEQEFFAYDNEIMQNIIDYLKSNEKMAYFSQMENMNQFAVPDRYKNIPAKDVWRDSCVNNVFLSVDLKKANFQALKHYSNEIFSGAETWEEFVGKFTDEKSKIHSKHLRQVIFGSVYPRRQCIYEKYLMCTILDRLGPILQDVYCLNNDEAVFSIGGIYASKLGTLRSFVQDQIEKGLHLDCHINIFTVQKLGKDMYQQSFIAGLSDDGANVKFKKVSHLMLPFVIRNKRGEQPKESDFVFKNETGNLCRFLENPLEE